jgi:hypothetical protein
MFSVWISGLLVIEIFIDVFCVQIGIDACVFGNVIYGTFQKCISI